MNLNFRKTALLAGICSVFSLGYTPQLFAVSSVDTVEAVQQTKKITGVVSDAMGPIIGANVLEKGTIWGIERSGFFNGREKWAKGFENQRV